MTEVHVRRPCPVCLGVMMEVLHPVSGSDLAVDRCGRCGGVWLDAGEAAALRRAGPGSIPATLRIEGDPQPARCHGCHAVVDRDAARCPACDHPNALECPGCTRPMQVRDADGVRLDVCSACRGLWLDAGEIRALWRRGFAAATARTAVARRGHAGDVDALDVVDAIWIADVMTHGGVIPAAGHAIGGAAEAVGNAPEAAAGLMEMLGSAASSVFEAVVGILEGFG